MSGAELFMRADLGLIDEQVEVLSGSMNLFMLSSILAAGHRATLVLANAFLSCGVLAMSLGGTFAALAAARFVASLGVGLCVVVAPVYTAEVAPAASRGVLASLPEVFVNTGILLGYVASCAFAGLPLRLGWRVMFAVGVLPPAVLAVGVLAMSDSPRWLAVRGRDDEALAVLARTSDASAEAGVRLEEIKRAVFETRLGGGAERTNLRALRSSSTVRRIIANVVALQFFHQASGIDAIVLYTPLVFKEAGMSSNNLALGATFAVGVVKTGSIFVATVLADRVGRRPLLLASTAGVGLTLAALAATLSVDAKTTSTMVACFASVLAYVAAFSFGLGQLTQAYSAEILPLRLRAQGTSLGKVVNRLICGLLSVTFISLANSVTMAGCLCLYAGMMVVACVFVYVRLPETRGRSLGDMDVLFSK